MTRTPCGALPIPEKNGRSWKLFPGRPYGNRLREGATNAGFGGKHHVTPALTGLKLAHTRNLGGTAENCSVPYRDGAFVIAKEMVL